MIAANLFADLSARGVKLSLVENSRLQFKAPAGALTDDLRAAMLRHRDELAQFIFEIEERAALMHEREEMNAEELAASFEAARAFVQFGTARADGAAYLRELLESNRQWQALNDSHIERTGVPLEILSIGRAGDEQVGVSG
jgi:hypothetical protein